MFETNDNHIYGQDSIVVNSYLKNPHTALIYNYGIKKTGAVSQFIWKKVFSLKIIVLA